MHRRVVGLFHFPWTESDFTGRSERGLAAKFRYAVWFKANPRSEAYMRALFAERHPEGQFVVARRDPDWLEAVACADTVFLLYPDAIGLRFGPLEREVRSRLKPWSALRVLNGRRREFMLDGATRRALALRRFLEAGMVGELAFLPVFMLATALLLAVDLLRGRR
jgi:hypothetical protein